MITDFSPVFCTMKEWNQLESLTGFMISINDILRLLDEAFTVETLFGPSVVLFFEHELASGSYMSREDMMRRHVNFMRVSNVRYRLDYAR